MTVQIEGHAVRLSNLTKVLYPAAGFTKAQVIDYYRRIAPVLIEHLAGHPLSLRRFPDGVGGEAFFEKNCPRHRPEWVRTTPLARRGPGAPINLCVAETPADILWLANLAALELHPYLWTTAAPSTPSMMVFDLDPGPGVGLIQAARVALRLRGVLGALGLESWIKSSGGKGLHLMVPLNTPGVTFEQTKAFSRAVASILERDDPARITTRMTKAIRPRRVFIDWSQNDLHKTTVAAYSLRGRERPTVSAPLGWDELQVAVRRRDASRLLFEARAVLRRVDTHGDLAAAVTSTRQRLPELDE